MHCFIHSLIHSFISERRWRIDGWQKRHRECFDLVHCAARPFDSSQKWNECCIFCVFFAVFPVFRQNALYLDYQFWFEVLCMRASVSYEPYSPLVCRGHFIVSTHCLQRLKVLRIFFTKEEQLLFCFANLYLLSYCIPYSCTEWL